MEPLLQLGRGFAMGAADLVPGVSGGTVALVLGIYERLVENISIGASALGRFLRADLRGGFAGLRRVEWIFLLPLLGGILVAVVSLAGPLTTLLEEEPVVLGAAFFGLILGSIPIAWGYLRSPSSTSYGIAAVFAVVVFFLLGTRGAPVADPSLLVFFGAGALAIVAMILPGISGSFILVTIGMYDHVLTAVDDFALTTVLVVGLGAALGLGLFSKGLEWLLEHHHDRVLAALVGLMVGSLRVLWPWPHDLGGIEDVRLGTPDEKVALAAIFALIGIALVLVVGVASRRADLADHADA